MRNFGYRCITKTFFVLGFVSFFMMQSLMAASPGTVKGKILDKETKELLPGATILVKNTSLGAASDINGNYIIHNVPTGTQTLSVSYIGYKPLTVQVTVSENEETSQDISLEATAITGQTVVVTAQAQGQLGAINQQLSSNTIENVVSKARLQELPDVNAAESIGRLPGVSIERNGGEATKVEIRGLDPKYSVITVNGVELPGSGYLGISPNGQSTGGTGDRSVDLSLISSNMLDGITLKKVVTADMNPNVLGGTVDLMLKEAPEGLQINGSAQGGYNKLRNYYGDYNLQGNVSDRFFDNKLGAIVSLHADNYDRSSNKFAGGYQEVVPNGVTEAEIQELTLTDAQLNRKRAGASLLLDYVIPDGKITGNGFFNQLFSTGLNHVNDMFVPGAGYNSNRDFYTLDQNTSTTNIFTSSVGLKQDFGWISYDASIARSGSENSEPNDRQWQFEQDASSFAGNLVVNPGEDPTTIAKAATVDTNATKLAFIYVNSYRLVENQTQGQANFKVPFQAGDVLSGYLKFGGGMHWIARRNDQNQVGENGINYSTGNNPTVNYIGTFSQQLWGVNVDSLNKQLGWLPITPFLTNYSPSNFLNGNYALGMVANQGMLNTITDSLMKSGVPLNIWRTYFINTWGYDYNGTEEYGNGYAMAEFDLGQDVTLLPGVRYETEHTLYHGTTFSQTTVNNQEAPPSYWHPDTTSRTNSFWLPDVNLILKPNDWLQIKMARTETLARPDYLEYAPITYIDALEQNVTAANVGLKTSRSTNYDIAASVYNNSIGLLSVDGFYKKINDLIFYATFKANPGVPIPDSASLAIPPTFLTANPKINTYLNNPNPATYYGFEAEWQTNFWYLPGILRGLVLDVNYTHIFSTMKLQYYKTITTQVPTPRPHLAYSYLDTSTTTRMPDQPSHIFNVTLGYDLGGFSARLSYLYQTDKLTSIGYDASGYPSPVLSTYSGPYGRWDVTLQQKFGGHFQLFANLNNLNAQPDRTLVGLNSSDPSYIEYYGFTMDLGIRYTL